MYEAVALQFITKLTLQDYIYTRHIHKYVTVYVKTSLQREHTFDTHVIGLKTFENPLSCTNLK
jgi:hypothetical protein